MRQFRPLRMLALGLAATSMVAVGFAAPAGAVVHAACAKAVTKQDLKHFIATTQLSQCTNPTATGGKGVMVFNYKNYATTGKIAGKVTWNKTGTLTIAIKTGKATSAQIAKCVKTVGKGASAATSTGTVTGGTGKAFKGIPKGSKFSETVCYSAKSVVTLFPGSKVNF